MEDFKIGKFNRSVERKFNGCTPLNLENEIILKEIVPFTWKGEGIYLAIAKLDKRNFDYLIDIGALKPKAMEMEYIQYYVTCKYGYIYPEIGKNNVYGNIFVNNGIDLINPTDENMKLYCEMIKNHDTTSHILTKKEKRIREELAWYVAKNYKW